MVCLWGGELDCGLPNLVQDPAAPTGRLVSHPSTEHSWLTPHSGPLSPVPFDLLFLLIVFPHTLESFRARVWIKRGLTAYWSATTSAFRLTSLVYGTAPSKDQRPEPVFIRAMWATFDLPLQVIFGRYSSMATFARVPATDQIVLLSRANNRKGTFVPLTPAGNPRTKEDKLRILNQDAAARRGGRDPVEDYTMVWLPRYWRTRVHLFILLCGIMAGIAVMSAGLVPLLVGRGVVGMVFGEVHDGYSLVSLIRNRLQSFVLV